MSLIQKRQLTLRCINAASVTQTSPANRFLWKKNNFFENIEM
jgi:hypothetical protein